MPLQEHPPEYERDNSQSHDRTHEHPHSSNEVSRTVAALIRDAAVLNSQVGELRSDIDRRLTAFDDAALIRDIAVLNTQVMELREDIDRRLIAQDKAVVLALTAADKTTQIAQATADKAVLKSDASASRDYLESQIKGLSEVVAANLGAQKDALGTALTAAKEALVQAQEASEKAIHKAEMASEIRFQGVNQFRASLSDQTLQFAQKSEVNYRFGAMDDKLHIIMSTLSEAKGKSQGSNWLWGVLLGVGGIVLTSITAVTLVLTRTGN